MKRSFLALVSMVTVGVLAIGGGQAALAQPDEWGEPDWWAEVCDYCSFKVHDDGTTVTPSCLYDDDICDNLAAPCTDVDVTIPALVTDVVGETVTLTYWNWWIPINTKDVWIKVQGTGGVSGSPPRDISVDGVIRACANDHSIICNVDADCTAVGGACDFVLDPPGSRVIGDVVAGVDASGNWWVEIHVHIIPQPRMHMITFTIPGGTGVAVDASWGVSCCDLTRGACIFHDGTCQELTEAECNTQSGKYIEDDTLCIDEIPAVSEWGLLVMALLGLAAGTIMFRRARAVAA